MQTVTYKYTFRLSIVFLFFCAIFLIIITRLYVLHILHHDFYVKQARHQYQTTLINLPERAHIYDRHGQPLALNTTTYSSFITPYQLQEPEQIKNFLKTNYPSAYKQLQKNSNKKFLFIKRNMTKQEIEAIKNNFIVDIKFMTEPHRYYPNHASSSVVGHTNIDNVGAEGIEYLFDKQLQGEATTYALEQDARRSNFYFKKELQKTGTQPTPASLTLDAKLQTLSYHELENTCKKFGAKEGAVLILNPMNGDILVMTCYGQNKYKNITVTDAYELGSVIKIFAALAALEAKTVTLDTLFDCQNTKHGIVNGRVINTVTAHGTLAFADVVARSNNIGIAQAMIPVGDKLYDNYTKLGFGKKIPIHLPGQQSGYINHPKNWSAQSLFSLSYGYEITATLLQLAQAFCIIANNGIMIQPHILLNTQKQTPPTLYSKELCAQIKTMLRHAVTHGTARRAHISGIDVMCKTGTANLLVKGTYDKTKNNFTCAGIVAHGEYRRVIVTFVKEIKKKRQYASTVAVPLFKAVAEQLLIAQQVVIT